LDSPSGIALDEAGGQIYFTQLGSISPQISRVNMDGSGGVETLVSGAGTVHLPNDIALYFDPSDPNPDADRMFWTDSGNTIGVYSADPDGSDLVEIVPSPTSPQGIAVDSLSGHVYWAEITGTTSGTIERANLDGTGQITVADIPDQPFGVALDFGNGLLYVGSFFEVYEVDLSQTFPISPSTYNGSYPDVDDAVGIAVDETDGGTVYWANRSGNTVYRDEPPGGSGTEIVNGAGGPRYLDLQLNPDPPQGVIPEPTSALVWLMVCGIGLGFRSRRRHGR
jgi:DNA-binding beta-propeller fold protein YncE